MRRIFAFNGDADGPCALQQLRLAEGRGPAEFVTGPKRRTALLEALYAGAGDKVTVLDLSFAVNAPPHRGCSRRARACAASITTTRAGPCGIRGSNATSTLRPMRARASSSTATSAARLCMAFATGGGREAAAGINHLDPGDVDAFVGRFQAHFRA